jgi:hypothetical protein
MEPGWRYRTDFKGECIKIKYTIANMVSTKL